MVHNIIISILVQTQLPIFSGLSKGTNTSSPLRQIANLSGQYYH